MQIQICRIDGPLAVLNENTYFDSFKDIRPGET
jgi:hypothetical protein